MRRASIARSSAFRLSAFYLSLFLASFTAADVAGYGMVTSYLYERLDSHVAERFREIEASFRAGGLEAAAGMIVSHRPAISGQETIYSLKDSTGRLLAGNVDTVGVPEGFSTLDSASRAGGVRYRLFRQALGTGDLVVGVSYQDTDRLRHIALLSFGLPAAAVVTLGLGAGIVLAFRTRQRIAGLADVMQAVGAGRLSARLPVSSRKDDIDAFAAAVNVALARLQTSVSAMKRVTTDIAHDLRTPISRLQLQIEAASESLGDRAAASEHLESALREVGRVVSAFDGLLRISQIEAGARRDRFAAVSLAELVDEMFETFRVVAQEKGHRLALGPVEGARGSKIEGDLGLLRQLCANLLNNALRHTPPGTRITISLEREDDDPVLVISDDGPGIPPAERRKVFQRFYRIEKSRTTEGFGLGLSLARAVAELHGAAVTLGDNAPGLAVRVRFARGAT